MLGKQLIQAAAGAAGAGGAGLYVNDVFNTFLYTGNSTASRDIVNGVDLTEGGLVWTKTRTRSSDHRLFDTENAGYLLRSNDPGGPLTASNRLTAFNNNGFTLGSDTDTNWSGEDFASWTFRKAPGFFDVVTYAGNGTAGRTVAHNLGSVPGMIIVKRIDASNENNWLVYHRSLGPTKVLVLDLRNGEVASIGPWNNTAPTSTHFTLGVSGDVNGSTDNYVAYVFAHDDQSFGTDSDESIIKCGANTHTTGFQEVNVGFEPQFLLFKRSTSLSFGGSWFMFDNMRGTPTSGGTATLFANNNNAEDSGTNYIDFTSTGFRYDAGNFGNNSTMIYMAIRFPNKPPTAGTEVFAAATRTGRSGNLGGYRSGFVVDMAFRRFRLNGTAPTYLTSRMIAPKYLVTGATDAEDNDSDNQFDYMDGYSAESGVSATPFAYMFKRAPGFFDVVAYSGGGSTTKNHNLEVVPELMIVKVRNAGGQWYVYSSTTGTSKYSLLSSDAAAATGVTWGVASSTFTVFGGANASNETYVSYLFATLSGISKVGSYTGTGNAINVDCGFSSGARFILIKRTDASGDWFVYNSVRGIVSGDDPYILLNTTDAEVTGTNYIDPLSSGFTVTTNAPTGLNASGGTYIFLAIA